MAAIQQDVTKPEEIVRPYEQTIKISERVATQKKLRSFALILRFLKRKKSNHLFQESSVLSDGFVTSSLLILFNFVSLGIIYFSCFEKSTLGSQIQTKLLWKGSERTFLKRLGNS